MTDKYTIEDMQKIISDQKLFTMSHLLHEDMTKLMNQAYEDGKNEPRSSDTFNEFWRDRIEINQERMMFKHEEYDHSSRENLRIAGARLKEIRKLEKENEELKDQIKGLELERQTRIENKITGLDIKESIPLISMLEERCLKLREENEQLAEKSSQSTVMIKRLKVCLRQCDQLITRALFIPVNIGQQEDNKND